MSIRQKKKQIELLIQSVKGIFNQQDLESALIRYNTIHATHLVREHVMLCKSLISNTADSNVRLQHWEYITESINKSADELFAEEENYMSILSTCASVAPLLGLFGTVWGLIHAFVRISQSQIADITIVAPGIAEALITTLAGLLVAIPALAMYNYVLSRMRSLDRVLEQLVHVVTSCTRSVFLFVGI